GVHKQRDQVDKSWNLLTQRLGLRDGYGPLALREENHAQRVNTRGYRSLNVFGTRETAKLDTGTPTHSDELLKSPERCGRIVCRTALIAALTAGRAKRRGRIGAAEHGARVSKAIGTIDVAHTKFNRGRVDHLNIVFIVRNHAGEHHDGHHHEQLNADERHRPPVDLAGGDGFGHLAGNLVAVRLFGCHGTQVEQGKTKRRMHERGLHVHGQQYPEPDEVDAELVGHRAQQRHDDERQLEKIEEEGKQKRKDADKDDEAPFTARQVDKQVFHPEVAVDAAEAERENRGAHQDKHHETR